MRNRSNQLLWTLLVTALLAASPDAAHADHHEADDEVSIETYAGGTEDPQDEEAPAGERMGALSDVRWGRDKSAEQTGFEPREMLDFGWMGIGRAPSTLTRVADLLMLRPLTAGFGVLGAVTYGIAIGPTLLTNPDGHDAMRQQLLYDPWLFIYNRPLGEAMPVATEVAAGGAEVN